MITPARVDRDNLVEHIDGQVDNFGMSLLPEHLADSEEVRLLAGFCANQYDSEGRGLFEFRHNPETQHHTPSENSLHLSWKTVQASGNTEAFEAMRSLTQEMLTYQRTVRPEITDYPAQFPFACAYIRAYPPRKGHIGMHVDINYGARSDAYLLTLTEGRRTTAKLDNGRKLTRIARIGDVIIAPEITMVDARQDLTEHEASILPEVDEPSFVLAAFRIRDRSAGFRVDQIVTD